MAKPKQVWVVRAGNDNELIDSVESKEAVAIGWKEMGDLSNLKTREEFKAVYHKVYPDDSLHRMAVNAGQVFRFAREIKPGDYLLTYDKASREILIGLAEGTYSYDPTLFGDEYPQIRRVNWLKRVSRDDFTEPARNSLGSTLTVFQVNDHLDEIHQLAKGQIPQILDVVETETPPFYEEVQAKADELIADLISSLDPYDFQDLVAAVLRAMNFKATSTSPGRDRGIDIVAQPDPLGYENPRIKAQVKHRKGTIGGPDMRSFLGVLRSGDNGLYVSTGGFTSDAKLEATQAGHPVTLLDRDDFIRLMLDNYENLEPEYKAVVPLRKVWIPTKTRS